MNNNLFKIIIFVFLCLGGVLITSPVFASGALLKIADSPAVYYLDGNNTRHLFPTGSVYKSWYNDYSDIKTVDLDELIKYKLGKNITVRPGIKIVTFRTDKNYYAVETGGVLREFDEEETIREIYGDSWRRRLITLPDGFFENYEIGEDIHLWNQLPDGMIHKLNEDRKYYYVDNGLMWPFADVQSLIDNGFDLSDVANTNVNYSMRQREITGFDSRIFDPVATSNASTADCENKKLKAAIILVAKEKYTADEVAKLTKIKDRLIVNFKWATNDLAELDVSYPITILSDDKTLLFTDKDGQFKPDIETINTFYDKNPDIFDFIILYNNFVLNESEIAKYIATTNDIRGTMAPIMHTAYAYGSRGKLKGIASMGNLDKYSVDNNSTLDQSVNYVLHEIGHHWSGRARFIDESGNVSLNLLQQDLYHWDGKLDFVSPLGGYGWQDNGDGTYTNKISLSTEPNKKKYSDLDLYLMGLLPYQAIDNIRYLVPDNKLDNSNTLAGHLEEVKMSQIIEVMGQWRCLL